MVPKLRQMTDGSGWSFDDRNSLFFIYEKCPLDGVGAQRMMLFTGALIAPIFYLFLQNMRSRICTSLLAVLLTLYAASVSGKYYNVLQIKHTTPFPLYTVAHCHVSFLDFVAIHWRTTL